MKKTKLISALTLTALLFTGCAAAETQMKPIGLDSAKTVALEAAGLMASDVTFTTAELDRRGQQEYYDVEFRADGKEYEYDIDALTGTVLAVRGPEIDRDDRDDHDDKPTTTPATQDTTPAAPVAPASPAPADPATPSTPTQTEPELIGEEKALELALGHAGLTAGDITFVKNGLDRDDGRQIYDVEFYSGNVEYDYDIDALTGDVLDFDHDAEYYDMPAPERNDSPDDRKDRDEEARPTESTGSVTASELTKDEAKAIALAQVPGATEQDIREFQVDYDDGRLEFEGTIWYNEMEYEFEIDGYSGAIRSWDVEPLDRDRDD